MTRTDPQREDAAQQFVRWLTATEQYVELCTALVYLPVRASVLTHPRYRAFLQTEPELAAIAGSMREVRTKPVDARWPVMQDALNAAREAVELGAATPAEALATAQARVEAALAREAQRGGANVAVFSGGAALALCALLLVAWRARRPGTALGAHPYPRGAHRLLVLPQVLFFGCFTAAPLLGAVGMSFVRWDLLSPPKFAGWGNYAGLLTSQEFHAALRRTLWWVLLVTPLGTCIALGVALLLHGAGRARRWFAPLYFLPSVSSLTALAILWWWMLDARHGLVNVVLDMLGVPAVDWLHDPRFALLGLATLEWWRACGLFIFFLAALQTVPAQLWDAAALDGAGAWARLRHVTLPALRPMIFFVGATLAMESFQAFDQIYVITQGEGGPAESTTTLSFLLYKTGFVHFKMGEASALALVSAMILLLVILLQRRVLLGGEGR